MIHDVLTLAIAITSQIIALTKVTSTVFNFDLSIFLLNFCDACYCRLHHHIAAVVKNEIHVLKL